MTISIITPSFNSSDYLERAIKSVLNQNYKNWEHIIIDGVSTDKTIDIVRMYPDSRIKINIEKDNGIYDAMNKGIKMAKGDWLYFLGSDDWLYDEFVLEGVFKDKEWTKGIVSGKIFFRGEPLGFAPELWMFFVG